MAADVADDDAEAAVAHRDIVEVVAAGRLGGVGSAADGEDGRGERRWREELLRDLPSQADLLAKPLGLPALGGFGELPLVLLMFEPAHQLGLLPHLPRPSAADP